VRIGDEQRYAGVLEWVEGAPLIQLIEASADSNYVAAMFAKLGELMGAMHNQASNWQIPENFSRQHLNAAGFVGEQPFWGRFWEAQTLTTQQRHYLGELRCKVAALLKVVPTHHNSYGLIHADLHPGNIIVHNDQMHVIDFDDAGFGWHIYDIAVALKNYEDQRHFDKAQAALIAGYRRKRTLSDATLQELPLFLLVRALATIGWVAVRPELGHSDYIAKLLNYVYANADSVLSASEN
jgi:Ser/Thr protein kinase RdoA (MazF antagonist)